MADLSSYDHVLIALKKGTQLIKYSRKGKPKFCFFRLSADEATLIWYSHGQERNLKLCIVSKIIVGQRTAVFRRYLRPEKDCLSFSLIYNNGERSLDLICKDQEETEVWLTGLNSLITGGQHSRHVKSDFYELSEGADTTHGHSWPDHSPGRVSIELNPSSDVGSEHAIVQQRTNVVDGFRLSVSSNTPSCTSTGSGQDDIESLGGVYVWGELWSDGSSIDSSISPLSTKIDILIPKPLETNVVLDVHQIACGVHHVVLVNRQGEVFTWGEESSGRLGHGIDKDFNQPHLVEFLALTNVDFIACGEYHTCAISTVGDLYTWGDGIHNSGILGHDTDASHWIPTRVYGPLEGIQVVSIACGTWHSAVITLSGKLFTFGDGKFGVLGHGDRETVLCPKEVEQLSGMKTIKVACGVWHTAALVEVVSPSEPNATMSSKKLFTWGDGDKYRLGHGNKEAYLSPTCVSALSEYNFHQIACGHTMTLALTTSGHIFAMGSNANGQLGNTHAEGKLPSLVQDRLVGEFIEEITCGACHVAVLTSRGEVFTWGKGANGRLGHGDVEDRKTPTLVDALKDKLVKSIVCGANFTASICIHKWVAGSDQSVCSGCRQAFGFTRKRHNCYNCGQVHCHACSSKKALRAALAPTPGKPHRVCDACHAKLKAAGYGPNTNKKGTVSRRSGDSSKDKPLADGIRSSRILPSSSMETTVKHHEGKSHKSGARHDDVVMSRSSHQQTKDVPSSSRPVATSLSASSANSRSSSPIARRPNSPSSPPIVSRGMVDNIKKSNGVLSQEVTKLQNQIKVLKQQNKAQQEEIQRLQESRTEAMGLVSEHYSNCREANEIVESVSTQIPEDHIDMCQSGSFISDHPCLMEEIQSNRQSAENNSRVRYTLQRAERLSATHDYSEAPMTDNIEAMPFQGGANGERQSLGVQTNKATEEFEPGVYINFIPLSDGTKVFGRVRFSKRKFSEQQAEEWWKENKERVLKTYSPTAPHLPSQ